MRYRVFAIALVFVATPVVAHDRVPQCPAPDADQVARVLSNPAIQEGIAAIVGQFADAALDTHVGSLARYADPRDHIRPNDTLGDLVKRDDPAFDRHLHDRTRGAVAQAGLAAGDVASMSAELQRTGDRLRRLLDSTASVMDQARDAGQ